ncbi:MAG: transcriptional regulatory protein RtcR [Flavobacteriales bacterium]|jgi:transcriptional regulatory protein RtcR
MKKVIFSILGTTLDRRGKGNDRWERWRPTLSMCEHEDFVVDRLELLFDNHARGLAKQVTEDIQLISPETEVVHHTANFPSPWDFESVYSTLLDFAQCYSFKPESEEYLVHITTGTHVAQICWFLLTEARQIPGKLLQTSPSKKGEEGTGQYQIIDLDLSKYDQIASRFNQEHQDGTHFLKSGIETLNPQFNKTIEQLEQVSIRSSEPILITGPTGAGKSKLARKVYDLRKQKGKLNGKFVAVNCATLRGDNTMSALFGHKKGAFTGAASDRPGLLKEAHEGLLFLDEIGELGLDEQAMLLNAVEQKQFIPFGSDSPTSSNFQLIAGTNNDLISQVKQGKFREDLLARIDLWTYQLPSLKERIEDLEALEANIEFELERFRKKSGYRVHFNKSAKDLYLKFGRSEQALWSANFRDLNSSITRMGTLANGGRISLNEVNDEIERLKLKWGTSTSDNYSRVKSLLPPEKLDSLDNYDLEILAVIIETCKKSKSMADAGRKLFNVSRNTKASSNDSHRVKKILGKYGLIFEKIKEAQ